MNILIHGTNWIGDAVMTIPAVRKLRRLFPDSRFTLQTREWAEGIFQDSDLFDEIVAPVSGVKGFLDSRNRKFDLAVIFPNSFKSALNTRLSGSERIFGYASEGRSLFLTDPVAVPEWKDTRHEIYYYLELASAIEQAYFGNVTVTDDLEPRLALSEERRGRGREILVSNGLNIDKLTIALAPGSTNSRAKRWHPESFAKLNDILQRELGANVVLLGSKDELEVSQQVVALSEVAPFDLTAKTDLADAAAVLSEIDLLVANDMGLAHLAPAVGTKTITIFGPTNPMTTRPFSPNASIITAAVECAPCMLRDCPIDHRCMTRISAGDVFEQAKAMLNK